MIFEYFESCEIEPFNQAEINQAFTELDREINDMWNNVNRLRNYVGTYSTFQPERAIEGLEHMALSLSLAEEKSTAWF